MASESSPRSMNYFQKVSENFGASPLADKLLDGEITNKLDAFPSTVRAWPLQFKQTDQERECRPIDGFIFPDEFQQVCKVVNEKTSSSSSGLWYTLHILEEHSIGLQNGPILLSNDETPIHAWI